MHHAATRAYIVRECAELAIVLAVLVVVARLTHVSLTIWLTVPLAKIAMSILVYRLFVRRSARLEPLTGSEAIVGREATALTPLTPRGHVALRGEVWSARLTAAATVAEGRSVRVVAVDGTTLHVVPTDDVP